MSFSVNVGLSLSIELSLSFSVNSVREGGFNLNVIPIGRESLARMETSELALELESETEPVTETETNPGSGNESESESETESAPASTPLPELELGNGAVFESLAEILSTLARPRPSDLVDRFSSEIPPTPNTSLADRSSPASSRTSLISWPTSSSPSCLNSIWEEYLLLENGRVDSANEDNSVVDEVDEEVVFLCEVKRN